MDSDNHQHTYTFGNVNECVSIFYHYSAFLQPYSMHPTPFCHNL